LIGTTSGTLQSEIDAIPSSTGLAGIDSIGNATDTVNVTFGQTVSGTDYYPTVSIENSTDANPAQFGYIITEKTTTGFTLLLSGLTDSANYKANWRIGNDAIGSGGGGSGISAIVEDTSPQLGGDLDANTHAIVAADHGTAATDQVVNVAYGTGAAPTASTTTEGALYFKYTA